MKKLLLWATLLGVAGLSYAQNDLKLPEVVPPSPTVASLMSLEEVPVDYYTGQPNISIPIYSKSLNKDLTLNIGLRYSTTGVQINNRSGWAGTGWALETGGVISRTVRGLPDEDKKQGHNRTGVLNNADFWNYDNLTASQKDEFNWKAKGSSVDRYDTELDLYQFNLLGISGRFVVVRDGTILKAKLLSKNQNIKIDITYNSTDYKISAFTVTDALGYIYTFDQIEESTSTPVNATVAQGASSTVEISQGGIQDIIENITAWHLSKIETSNGTDLATFIYEAFTHTYEASRNRTENVLLTSLNYDVTEDAYNKSILKPRTIISHYNISAETKKPKSITFKDGTSVHFSATSSHPETFGAVLNSIAIKDNAPTPQTNKTFNFTYDMTDRLWLTKVSEVGGSLIQNYTLEYNDKANLPAYGSVSDNWGYHEGDIQKGLLSKIHFPTGGNKSFTFEHNTFAYERNQSLTTDDYYSLNPNNTTNAISTLNYTISNTNGTQYQLGNNTVVLNFDQTVTIENNIQVPSNVEEDLVIYAVVEKNGFEYRSPIQPQGTNTVFLEAGTYSFYLDILCLNISATYSASGVAKLNYRNQSGSFEEAALAGGVRIKEVSFFDNASATIPEKTVNYEYNEPNSSNPFLLTDKSSGAVDARLGGISHEYDVLTTKSIILNPPSGAPTSTSISYRVKEKLTNARLTQSSYVGYKYVTVSETANGKSLYEFTTAYDFPSANAAFAYPFPPTENVDYKRGSLLNEKVFNVSGQVLKEKINSYNYVKEIIAPSFKVFDPENCAYIQFYDTYSSYVNASPSPNPYNIFSNCGVPSPLYRIKDDLVTGWTQLTQTISKDYYYNTGNPVVETRKTYAYNDDNYQVKETHTYMDEGGIEQDYKTETFYPVGPSIPSSEFTSGELSTIAAMANNINKINVPVLVRTYKNGTLMGSVKSTFNSFYTNVYELDEIQTSKTTDAYEKVILYHGYYNDGNFREVSKEDGTHIVYIWGYDGTLPIAKIENATFSDIPTSVYNAIVAASNADTSASAENTLRTELDKLRSTSHSPNLANSLVTTFTYDPLVGVTSITDTRGETIFYHYDSMNRLETVKDAYGKIVSKNEYHYKN